MPTFEQFVVSIVFLFVVCWIADKRDEWGRGKESKPESKSLFDKSEESNGC